MKKTMKITGLVLSAAMLLPTVACNQNKLSNDANTINMYVLEKGYGLNWLKDLKTGFLAKYPDYKIEYRTASQDTVLLGEVDRSSTVYDLIFCGDDNALRIVQQMEKGVMQFESLNEVYEATVDGEAVKDKMSAEVHELFAWENEDGENEYYMMPWAGGADALCYHHNMFVELYGENYKLPRTTNELKKVCDDFVAKGQYPLILCASDEYYHFMYQTWWAQYEGMKNVDLFYEGKVIDPELGAVLSPEVFRQEGIAVAMNTLEDFVGKGSPYIYQTKSGVSSNSFEWRQTQDYFEDGAAAMFPNGDWNNLESGRKNSDVRMMSVPVVSELGEKLGITEEDLCALIDYVDGVTTTAPAVNSTKGYTAEQLIERVGEARNVLHTYLGDFTACIPYKANAKGPAKEFLKYMVSDEGQQIYARAQKGLSLPFGYDAFADTDSQSYFDEFSLSTARLLVDGVITRSSYKTPLARVGLTPFKTDASNVIETNMNYGTKMTVDGKTVEFSAQYVIDYQYNYYTKANNDQWNKLKKQAGL